MKQAVEKPFGWEVDVAIRKGAVAEEVRTFHYRACSRRAAEREAFLRLKDDKGERISIARVIESRPVTEKDWRGAYGIGVEKWG